MQSTLEHAVEAPRAHAAGAAGSPLRVLHLVSSLQVGGMEHFVLRLAEEQQRYGHTTAVLALRDGPLVAEAERMGVQAMVLRGGKLRRVAENLWHIGRFRPDVIHPHNPSSLHYAVLGKKVSRGRIVMTYHGEGKGTARMPSAREWRELDALVAVSEGAAAQISHWPHGGKLSAIRNGVQFVPASRERAAVRAELGLGDEPIGIIVARLDRLKGHAVLLRAAAALRDRGLPFTLLVAGDGAERAPLEALAVELGLGADRVRFLGFRKDVPDLLAASDFFVLPSETEGLPLSVLEAMAHRLAVIATPVGGVPELVPDEHHGLLVPVRDVDALAQALARVVADADLRATLGAHAQARCQGEFGFDRMTRQYVELYRKVIG